MKQNCLQRFYFKQFCFKHSVVLNTKVTPRMWLNVRNLPSTDRAVRALSWRRGCFIKTAKAK